MNVEITPLPGIGTRQDFMIRSGRRVGVITYRDGKFELIVSKQDDPDSCTASIPLTPEEASTLAGLLGAPQLVAHLSEQHRDITGITTRQLPVTAFANRTLGDTALRTRTGASIVAVVRSGNAHPSPGPEFLFENGDLAVVVGTAEGLDAASHILTGG
ncbi:potassium transporter TrkA [Lentzea sp. NBRC 105346]|uniref:cation:proton antiporter regulatory subunit n=1 Tax=Lentzea sp. NBRC 105346 TaxID=3032205 RepID=UPI0024A3F2EC|nr:cation:proton antiporter regulatory subunit [Lentzea sp. NBRC 105346]GLZ32293.1 potassium transporter TrkA [Lentzea sp. NBRC 105346]